MSRHKPDGSHRHVAVPLHERMKRAEQPERKDDALLSAVRSGEVVGYPTGFELGPSGVLSTSAVVNNESTAALVQAWRKAQRAKQDARQVISERQLADGHKLAVSDFPPINSAEWGRALTRFARIGITTKQAADATYRVTLAMNAGKVDPANIPQTPPPDFDGDPAELAGSQSMQYPREP